MPILRITITGNAARLHRERRPLMPVLNRALRADQGPVTIMVHGFKYHPGHPVHCPHGPIPARPTKRAYRSVVNWPARLGMHGQPGGGLGLSLGWSARGSIWAACASAQAAGHTLAALISDIRGVDPDRKINLIAHSLGARVALTAIRAGAPGAVNRAILLAAAEYAEAKWVRMQANMQLGRYDVATSDKIPDPVWPTITFREILEKAFGKDHLIDSLEHPVIRQLQGDV